MTKTEKAAETLVRKIIGETFGQKVDKKILREAAEKVARAVDLKQPRTA